MTPNRSLALILAASIPASAAMAQESPVPAAEAAAVELPAIEVTTANKRPQKISSAKQKRPPAASSAPSGSGTAGEGADLGSGDGAAAPAEVADANVSVRSGEQLRRMGIEKVSDLEKAFPGLTIRSRGNRAYANFTVRGVTSADFYNPSVQVLIDGVPQAASAFAQDLVDVERVEFLRGPQGVLYGANAYGGVLNIYTRQPRHNTASVSSTISNLTRSVQGSATGVLAKDALFVDLAAKREREVGEIDDILTGDNNVDDGMLTSGRASLRYQPKGGPFDMALTYAREDARTHEETYIRRALLQERELDVGPSIGFPNLIGTLDRTIETASAAWNYRIAPGLTFTSISAWHDSDYDRVTFGSSFPEREEAFSQEARLAYTGPGPVTGVVGFYFRDSDFSRQSLSTPGFVSRNAIGTTNTAGFGELTWHITRDLDLTGGVRYSHDESEIDYDLFPGLVPAGIQFSGDVDYNAWQPKVSLGYQLTPTSRIYGLVSKGYKPGGFQHAISRPTNPVEFLPYDPEEAWNYEIGFSTRLWSSLDLSVAGYHIRSQDKQIYVGPVGFQTIRNASEAESTGVELEANWQATRNLNFLATANFGKSEFTDFVDAAAGTDFTGNRLPYAPDVTATLFGRYLFNERLWSAKVALSGGVRYASRTYFDEANALSQEPFATYDAAMELMWDNGLALKVFGENLSDEVYAEYSFMTGGFELAMPSEGRLIGVTLSAKY